jgi:hypothetical protein
MVRGYIGSQTITKRVANVYDTLLNDTDSRRGLSGGKDGRASAVWRAGRRSASRRDDGGPVRPTLWTSSSSPFK